MTLLRASTTAVGIFWLFPIAGCFSPGTAGSRGGDGEGGLGGDTAWEGGAGGEASVGGAGAMAGDPGSPSTGGNAGTSDGGSGGVQAGSGGAAAGAGGTAGAPGSAGAGGTAAEISLSRDIAPLIKATCGLSGCHVAGSAQWHGMDLVSPAKIYAAWVNVKGFDHCNEYKGGSLEFPVRVTPGKLAKADSYLITKIGGPAELCGPSSFQMPPPATSGYWFQGVTPSKPLTAAQQTMLKQWILQGAKNN